MRTVIVDYGSGNLRSAAKAFERALRERDIAGEIRVSADPREAAAADRIVLPGVGAFAACMNGLAALSGMIEALTRSVRERGRPLLGICVGMQLLAERGHEHGLHRGLGWIAGEVRRIAPPDPTFKVPHMGWNDLTPRRAHKLLDKIAAGAQSYFVHSYHFSPSDRSDVVATTDYGGELVAIVGRDNVAGTQFHPEKSQETGLRLIANFLTWRP
ncbi:MAG TPA: imidazole glycerol phosphate synthase subunit HisH [Alphaproteobacteria bacterium]|jgi:glutamine amidotransferase|nr:imidazole glycerol phosphate synthase subunit HisH [Alphaproteobacteria bacterium]